MSELSPDSRWRFRDAWRALRRLFADPDDTAAVFEVLDALPGRSYERMYERFARSEAGARILREQRALLPTLRDRAALLALPVGTLGRAYAEFMEAEQLSANGLVDASTASRETREPDPSRRLFYERLRDAHDVEHVATGYGRDLLGEIALLALYLGQVWSPGLALIVGMAYFESGPESRRMIRQGFRRGRRAAWLSGQDWEALLPRPLDEVRRELRLDPPPVYTPEYSAGAPAAA